MTMTTRRFLIQLLAWILVIQQFHQTTVRGAEVQEALWAADDDESARALLENNNSEQMRRRRRRRGGMDNPVSSSGTQQSSGDNNNELESLDDSHESVCESVESLLMLEFNGQLGDLTASQWARMEYEFLLLYHDMRPGCQDALFRTMRIIPNELVYEPVVLDDSAAPQIFFLLARVTECQLCRPIDERPLFSDQPNEFNRRMGEASMLLEQATLNDDDDHPPTVLYDDAADPRRLATCQCERPFREWFVELFNFVMELNPIPGVEQLVSVIQIGE